jgi:hypothetical protein
MTRPANSNVPIFPAEGSFEWHWLQHQIHVVLPAAEREWDLEQDLRHEAQLARSYFDYWQDPDEEEWPWYADAPHEVQESEVFGP